jgi:pilus assembly protein CpaD
MHLRRSAISMTLLLALAACVPGVAEYTKTEAPVALQVQGATGEVAFAFAAGSARLARGEDMRLDHLLATGVIRPADRVEIAAAGQPRLAEARTATIASRLLRWGIVADARPMAGVAPNQALVMVGRYAVTLPPCPNWSMTGGPDFTNQTTSNFGCADAINLGLMVASPGDLTHGRTLAAADGKPAASAVGRYLDDKVTLPTETTLGPVAASSSTSTAGVGAPGAIGP